MSQPQPRMRFRQVDMLRGVAASIVVFSHYLPFWNDYLGNIPVLMPNMAGNYAVKLFFVVSGFVIFFSLNRATRVTDFVVLRFSRLYPVYIVSLLLATGIGVLVFGRDLWVGGFVTNLTMFQEFMGFTNLDNVYWSLTVELAFYLNCAWLFALGWHNRPKTVVLTWLLLSLAWALTLYTPPLNERTWLPLWFVFDHSSYFAMGIVFYDAKLRGWSRASSALVVLSIGVQALLQQWEGVAVAGAIAAIFALAMQGHFAFLVNRFTLWLGAISYSLYLIHRNLGYQALRWLDSVGLDAIPAISLTVMGALALATALTYWIERPASRFLRRAYQRRKAKLGTTPT